MVQPVMHGFRVRVAELFPPGINSTFRSDGERGLLCRALIEGQLATGGAQAFRMRGERTFRSFADAFSNPDDAIITTVSGGEEKHFHCLFDRRFRVHQRILIPSSEQSVSRSILSRS